MALGMEQIEDKFKQFDYATDFSDHYYCHHDKYFKKIYDRIAVRMIMKEWKILEKQLPESIFVRIYEGKVELLRAAIIGPQNTPYHNGLYFFDVLFPPDYPVNPPMVRYRSFGPGLNPNLYKNGFICLSSLNTWEALHTEMWNPLRSTMLQVLVSLQGLVLNEKPFYNEPGFILARSWESYNAKIFVLSCKTMLNLLKNPFKNFEVLIRMHFRKHASTILRACIAYRECRVQIGYYNGDDTNKPSGNSKKKIKVSNQFKNSMDDLYPKLFKTFNAIGAPLQNIPVRLVNGDVNIQEGQAQCIISKLIKACFGCFGEL